MKKNFIRYVVLLCCVIATVFTACTTDDDKQTAKPTDAKALVGTWECDLSGRTFALWNYGKAWNVWTFNADGTGVCDVFFLAKTANWLLRWKMAIGNGSIKPLMANC